MFEPTDKHPSSPQAGHLLLQAEEHVLNIKLHLKISH